MFFLSIRHLLSRKKQTFFIFFGIMLGTVVYVTIAGMQLGFQEFIVDQLVNNDAHIKVMAHEEEITEELMTPIFYPQNNVRVSWLIPPFGKRDEAHILYPQGWFEKLSQDVHVVAYSEQLVIQVIAGRGSVKIPSTLVGMVPEKQMKVTTINDYMLEGSVDAVGNTGNRVVAGKGLLQKIGARMNDTVFVNTGEGQAKPFKIVGVFELGVHQIDEGFMYGALKDVQALNNTAGRVSHIAIRLEDVSDARSVATTWQAQSYDKVQSWDQANANILQIFTIQDLFRVIITTGILIIVAFGIYNVLNIIVNQKKREIAILRALGYPPKDILLLFATQGVILGITGAVFGLLVGYGVCYYLKNIDIDIMGKHGLSVSFDQSIYVTGFMMSFFSSVLASILPARAASKFTPIDIIRMEG